MCGTTSTCGILCLQIQHINLIYALSKFHPLEVVGRGSETQLQVDEI